jgi:Protein of unknown function (DUF3800)
MKTFIDDSGSFSLYSPGISLFCAVTIADRDFPALLDRFIGWRRSVLGRSEREVKGAELTEKQLNSFVNRVLPASDHDIWLTAVGIDTKLTSEAVVARIRQQASAMFMRASELMGERENFRVQEMYRQMSGWANKRSSQNVLWIIALEETVVQSLQHSIVRFMEPEDDAEFESLRILIDESFIRRDEHVIFWREWLRNGLMKPDRSKGILTPHTWKERAHPFRLRYSVHPGLFNFNSLFMRQTGFFRSHNFEGLQLADICANILYRHHRGARDLASYRALRPRIVGEGGREMTSVLVNESGLHKDDVKNHVRELNIEEWKRRADERGAKPQPGRA